MVWRKEDDGLEDWLEHVEACKACKMVKTIEGIKKSESARVEAKEIAL